MSALPIIATQKSPSAGLFTYRQGTWAGFRPSWDRLVLPYWAAIGRPSSLSAQYERNRRVGPTAGQPPDGAPLSRCRPQYIVFRLGLNASKSESTLETTDGIPFARPVHPHSSIYSIFRVSSASILCRRLKRERGIVRRRVTLSLRSAEILPWFYDPPSFGCVINPLELETCEISEILLSVKCRYRGKKCQPPVCSEPAVEKDGQSRLCPL